MKIKSLSVTLCIVFLNGSLASADDLRAYNSAIVVQERLQQMGDYEVCGEAMFTSGVEQEGIGNAISYWSVPVCGKADSSQSFLVSVQCLTVRFSYPHRIHGWQAHCQILSAY